jgi:flagellar biosynthesis protein FlhB
MTDTSTSEARTEPPHASQAEQARSAGHWPRAELAGFTAACVMVSALLNGFADRLSTLLKERWSTPLRELAQGHAPRLDSQVHLTLERFGRLLLAALALTWLAIVLARGVAQGFTFVLSRRTRRTRFGKLSSSRATSTALWALASTVAMATSLRVSLSATVNELPSLLSSLALRASGLFVLVALCDTWLARADFWRSLWMTRSERRREEREAYGNTEMRAARERARHDVGPEIAVQRGQ